MGFDPVIIICLLYSINSKDDTEATARERLVQYHTNVTAVRGFYEDLLARVDGDKAPDAVFDSIKSALRAKR
jgi:adenylate kinase family enzyme